MTVDIGPHITALITVTAISAVDAAC